MDAALRLAIFDLTRTPAGKAGELPCPTVLAALMEKIADRPWTVSDEDFTSRNFVPGSGGQAMFLKMLRREISLDEMLEN